KSKGISDLPRLLARCGIPGTKALWETAGRTYQEALGHVQENCKEVAEDVIEEARNKGLQNSNTYLAMHDLDVYVATSMRDPLHFTTNWTFVQSLFHDG